MSSGLDPVIFQKLEAFSRRRRKLIILRGIFAAVAMLLATMMLVALVDYLFVLPDWVRWSLSGLAYLAVLITEWRASLRLLLHAPGPRRLARLIEHAEPKLREDLISAVELGQTNSHFDSEEFRRLVQADVASRLEGVNMDRLLPVQLLRRTMILAGVVAVVCFIIFAASGFQFGTLLMRAMLPMANLARVSKVQVTIVEPAPSEGVVPQGDSVPLVIEITGQRTNKAVLETFTKSGGREIVPMTATAPDRFVANIQVARDDVAYRVRAGDALTRKYQLKAMPRPQVVRFHKTFRYPEYVKLPEKRVTEENGDLAGLEGTLVNLELDADQPVKAAELRMDQGKESSVIQLKAEGNKLTASIPLQALGYYRVHLVAANTGFENKFSPEYELRPEADLVPQIDLEKPTADLILPSNEVVEIRGKASDDYGLAKIAQLIRVNDGPWKEASLGKAEGKEMVLERRWDLYEQGVKAGDLLTTKLVAVDLKGSRAESRPVRISVTSSGFESKRLTSLDSQRQLLAALKALRTSAETMEKQTRESREQMDRLSENDPQRKQVLASFTGALDDFERAAGGVVTQLHDTLRGSTPGHTTGEFVILGRLFARMWAGTEQNARDAITVAAANETLPFVRDLVREAAEASSRAAHRARQAEEGGRAFVTSEAIDVLNESFQVIAREQERITELAAHTGDDAAKWSQVINRLRVVLSQSKNLGDVMRATAEHATDGFGDRLRRLNTDFEKHRVQLESTFEKGATQKELLEPIKKFARSITDFHRAVFDIKRDYMHPPARAFQQMLQEVQPTWANFEKTREEVEQLSRNDRLPQPQRSGLMNARWDSKFSVLKSHGDAEEARQDSDAYFVSDIRATTLALNGIRDPLLAGEKPFSEEEKKNGFKKLDRAFRILESAHNLAEVHEGLSRLATAERWEVTALRARTANPRDWEWLEARMKALPEELGRTQMTEDSIRQAIQSAQKILGEAQRDHAWRAVNEEMKQRLRPEVTPRAVSQDTERVAAFVKQALDHLRVPVEDARKLITEMAPKLSEMMAKLAKDAEKLQKETAEQAQKASEKSPDQIQADAKRQLAEQQNLNRDVEALKDAVRSDANKQNMLEQEGRERARDADDALAMLKEPPPAAEEALAEAAAKTEGADQQPLLDKAAVEQQKLADALKQLSEHYDSLEKGNPQETRLALRENEKALGMKEAMDQRYARAEQLAQMAQSTPEEMLKQLEKALPQNPLMQQELSGIAKSTLDAASNKLADASQRENAVAEQVKRVASEQQAQAQREAEAEAQRMAQAQQNAAQAAANPSPEGTPPNPAQASPEMAAQQQGAQQQAEQKGQQTAQRPPQPANNAQGNEPGSKAMAENNQAQQNAAQAQQPSDPSNPSQPAPQNPQLAQAASQQAPIAQAATEAGMDVARAGRHEQRLQNTEVGQKLEQLGDEIRETGGKEVVEAQQALEKTQMAAQAQTAVNAAQSELQNELNQLAKAQSSEPTAQGQAAEAQPAQGQPQGAQPPQTPASQAGQQQQSMQAQNSQPAQPSGQSTESPMPGVQASPMQQPGAQPPQTAQASQEGTPAGQQGESTPATETAAQQGTQQSGMFSAANASPQEQVWMARTLDVLDSALHAEASQQQGKSQQQAQSQPGNQPGQGQQSGQQQSQPSAEAMAKAQQAMNATAQAAAAAMRASRSQESQSMQPPSSALAQGDQQATSQSGADAQGSGGKNGTLPGLQAGAKAGDWGKLPKKVAEQLSQGQRETVAGEYRSQVETYYRVIAERAKKP